MAGTKMTLYREGGLVLDWVDQHIVVDQAYLSTHTLLVTVSTIYELGLNQLDVYLNGHRLIEGHGYTEIDEDTIRLLVSALHVGDEIFIRNWRNKFIYSDTNTLANLYTEVVNARKYKNTDSPYTSLDARLDAIQGGNTKVIVFVFPGNSGSGVQKTYIKFPYDGEIVNVYASTRTVGTTDTELNIEKISQEDFDLDAAWSNIMVENLWIDGGDKSSNTATTVFELLDTAVAAGDHFRVNVINPGSGVSDLVIEIEIVLA